MNAITIDNIDSSLDYRSLVESPQVRKTPARAPVVFYSAHNTVSTVIDNFYDFYETLGTFTGSISTTEESQEMQLPELRPVASVQLCIGKVSKLPPPVL